MGICESNHKKNQTSSNSTQNGEQIKKKENIDHRKPSLTLAFIPVTMRSKKEEIKKYYNLMNSIGKGTYGLVREAIDFRNDKRYAIKTLEKKHFPEDKIIFLQREIDITMKVNHDNIIKCYEVYEDRIYVHFVFDLCQGGDLFEYIISNEEHRLSEQQTAQLFAQMMDALHYLCSINIIHRDIKLENFLVMQEESLLRVKLIDFGFAVEVREGEKIREKLGSLNYMAPEIHLDKDYDFKADMWAVGVVLYNMLSGKQPFSGENEDLLINKIINDEINFSYDVWNYVSKDCKNLICSLLSKNPDERPTPFEAKNHSWVQSRIKSVEDATVAYKFNPKADFIGNIITSLNANTNMKNDIFGILLGGLEIVEAEKCRMYLKQNNPITDSLSNFMVTYEVFLKTVLDHSNSSSMKNQITEILENKIEQCRKQKIDYDDFFNSFDNLKEIVQRERIWNMFKNNDIYNTGYLPIARMTSILQSNKINMGIEKIKEILKSNNCSDFDNIDFENFFKIWEIGETQINQEKNNTPLNN